MKMTFAGLCLLTALLPGRVPERLLALRSDGQTATYLDNMEVTVNEGAVQASFAEICAQQSRLPWSRRKNTRTPRTLRFRPDSKGVCAVEEHVSSPPVCIYQGDALVGHVTPPPSPPAWEPRGTTAEDGECARIWEYVRAYLDRQTP